MNNLRFILGVILVSILASCSQAPDLSPQLLSPKQTSVIGDNSALDLVLHSAGVYTVGNEYNNLSRSTNGYLRNYRDDGTLVWSRSFSAGSRKSISARSVAVDSQGNIYVAGWTDGVLSGTPNYGGRDGFLRKYNNAGNIVWTHSIGTSAFDEVWKVTVDRFDNVYVAGLTSGTFRGQYRDSRDTTTNLFVVRYSPWGRPFWVRQTTGAKALYESSNTHRYGWSSFRNATGLVTDSKGAIYVTGLNAYYGGYSSGRPISYESPLLWKLGAEGQTLWTWSEPPYAPDFDWWPKIQPGGVTVDAKDNVYLVSSCTKDGSDDMHGPEHPAGGKFCPTNDVYDLLVQKFSPNGSALWHAGSLAQTTGKLIVKDASMRGNALFVAGYTYGTVDPRFRNQGRADAFSLRMDFEDSGYLMHYLPRQIGSSAHDVATAVVGTSLSDHYLAGYTGGVLPGQTVQSGFDAFLLRRFSQGWGSAEWLRQY